MKKNRNDFSMAILPLTAVLLFFFPFEALSQDFPAKPITVYCGFEAGATTDLTARGLSGEAQKELGVPVVVENKTGGGGSVAATLLASKKPDGYTLGVVGFNALYTIPMMSKVAYHPFKDFTYILSYGRYIGGICVKKESPINTIKDLIDHARKNPGIVSYSSAGIGAPQALAVEYLAKQANVKFKHVPFKGGAPACTALLGGHVDFTAGGGGHLNYVKQGLFRMLAIIISEEKSDPKLPEIPTLIGLGYKDIPPSRFMLLAPKGLPDPIFGRLERAFRKAAHSPEFQKVMDNLDLPSAFKDRRQLEAEYPVVSEFYSKLLKDFGIIK